MGERKLEPELVAAKLSNGVPVLGSDIEGYSVSWVGATREPDKIAVKLNPSDRMPEFVSWHGYYFRKVDKEGRWGNFLKIKEIWRL